MRERDVEAYLTHRVRALGGISLKLAPTTAGMPDRMVIFPREILLVEVKTDTGRLRPAQVVWIDRLKRLGIEVTVLYGKKDVDVWLSEREKE